MKILLKDLLPGQDYELQARIKSDGTPSEWSPKFKFTTTTDTIAPKVPTGVLFNVTGEGYLAQWNSVTENTDNSLTTVEKYEMELRKGSTVKPFSMTANDGTVQEKSWTFSKIKQIFGDTTSLDFRVRSINLSKLPSTWSAWTTATIGAPGAPTNAVVEEIESGIKLSWTPPANTSNVAGYRVYVGSTAGFTPSSANRVYEGTTPTYTYNTLTFSLHYFKIRSYSNYGQESTDLTAQGTPKSPFVVDSTPPDIPGALTVTAGGTAPNKVANVSWTFTASGNSADIQGFAIKWRKVGDTNWNMDFADKASRAMSIPLPQPFANYEFQIGSYDFVGNYSAFSGMVTLSQSVPGPPPQATGVTATGSLDGLAIKWTASTAADVISGGYYEVNIAKDTGFTNSLLSYNTGNTYIDVNGLAPNTTFYVRVRAVDVEGTAGTWSATLTTATTQFPVTALSDGAVPTSSPAATVTGGIGYLYVNWTATTNADPVTYEVHISTTTNFTPSGSTKVAETPATNIVLEKDAAGTNLAYGTTYYIKLLAKDRDGSASSYGTQGSGTPIKAVIGDLTLVPSDIGAPTTAQAQGYANTAQTNAISAAATDATTKANQAYADAQTYTNTRESAITTAYTNAITTSANGKNKVTHSTSTPGTTANTAGDTWFQYSNISGVDQIIAQWRGTGGTSWVSETVNSQVIANLDVGKLTTGTMSAAIITVNSTGQIKSNDYVSGSAGWSLSNGGLQINDGVVDAKVLKTNTAITNNLFVKSTLTIGDTGTAGFIQSKNYVAGTSGWSLGHTSGGATQLEINQGSIKIGAVTSLQNTIDAAWQNRNPFFADWTSTYPTGVANWASTAAPTKETAITRSGGTAMRFTEASTGNRGVDIAAMLNTYLPYEDYVVVEADVYLVSGNFSGSGILLDWTGATAPNRATVNFHTIEPNPTTGRWYRFTQTLKRPTASGTWTSWSAWAMTNYAPNLSAATAKDIIFDKIGFRAATVEEITAYNAPGNLSSGLSTTLSSANSYADTAAGTARTGAVNDLKTLWGHPSNTTLIDGGDIFTRSIRAQTLVLADATNYISDPLFQDNSSGSWSLASGSSVVAGTGTTPGYLVMNAGVINSNQHSGDAAVWNTNVGEQFFVSMEVWGDAANTGTTSFTACMAVYNAGGTAISFPTPTNAPTTAPYGPAVTGYANVPTGAWNKVAGTITMPADAYSFRFLPFINATVLNNKVRVRNIKIIRRNGGELIIDGTIKANALTTGDLSAAILTLQTGGQIKTSNGEVIISNTGIQVTGANSSITASSLTTGTFASGQALTVNGNMTIQGNTTIASSGYIQSNNYVASSTGFRLSAAGLDIYSGTISAGTLVGGTISSPNIIIGANGKLTVDSSGLIQSNNYSPGVSGWRLSATGLDAPGLSVNVGAGSISGGTFTGGNFIIGSGGTMQSSNWNGSSTGWQLGPTGLTMYAGTLYGLSVTTNQLSSINGNFSINGSGQAVLAGASISGNVTVSNSTSNFIQSANYVPGSAGWRMTGAGNLEASNGNFRGDITGASGSFSGTVQAGSIQAYSDPDGEGDGSVLPFSTKMKARQGMVIKNGLLMRSQLDMNGNGIQGASFINGAGSTGPEIRGSNVTIPSLNSTNGSNSSNNGNQYCRVTATGILYASTTAPSARWLKTDIQKLEFSHKQLLTLQPRTFRWKDNPDRPYGGFIADEMGSIPGMEPFVGYNKDGIPDGIDYPSFTAALLEVDRQQQQEIDSNLEKIKKQEERICELEMESRMIHERMRLLESLVQSLLDN